MAGINVCNGRLRGAMQLGCRASSTKPSPRLWKLTPARALTMPDPKSANSGLVEETAMPCSSTMGKQTVSGPEGFGSGPKPGPAPAAVDALNEPVDHPTIEQVADRHGGGVGVGHETVAHGIGEARRLHQHMVALDRDALANWAQPLEHFEQDQRHHAMVA